MSPPSSADAPVICAICGKPIRDVESFQVGTSGQNYHLDCVRQRQQEGNPPEITEKPPTGPK